MDRITITCSNNFRVQYNIKYSVIHRSRTKRTGDETKKVANGFDWQKKKKKKGKRHQNAL